MPTMPLASEHDLNWVRSVVVLIVDAFVLRDKPPAAPPPRRMTR